MKKKVWIAIGVVILILLMVGVSVYRQAFAKGPVVKTEQVKMEEVSSTLMIPGILSLLDEQRVYVSPENGVVKEILVSEGQQVNKGDVLVKLENDQLQLELEQNKLSVESGYLKIDQIKNQIEALNKKQKKLTDEVGEKEAKEQLASEFDSLNMEKKMADIELKQTLLQKETLEKKIKDLQVTSLLEGTILTVNQQASNSATAAMENAQEPLLSIGNLSTMIATGSLSEYDTLKVDIGQKVVLTSDAVPGEQWEGEIMKIGTLPKDQSVSVQGDSQAVQYPVTVKVVSGNMTLKPGFQLIMEIETEKKTGLVIPVNALLNEDEQTFVYILDGEIVHKKEVKVGITTGEKIEIVKGLKEKEQVIVEPLAGIKDGMEVRIK